MSWSNPTVRRAGAALALLGALLWATAVAALDPPHDSSNNIDCAACHVIHGDIRPPRGAEQEALCLTCHNPTGPAATMADVANHTVNGGALVIDCASCHDAHGPHQVEDPHSGQVMPNRRLIRSDPDRYVPGALTPTISRAGENRFVFAENDPPWNGICQSCHTQTSHHTRDDAGDHTHLTSWDCSFCHPHQDGFLPTQSCLTCHDREQGTGPTLRRQIVEQNGDGLGDFLRTSHHAQGPADHNDCAVCHYGGSHTSGVVRLIDPDLGPAVIYDFDPSQPEQLTAYCLACHDADGAATAGGIPFSDGIPPPDIDRGGLWTASAHAVGGGSPLSCLGDGVTGCHGNGHGSNLPSLLQPVDGTPGPDNVDAEEGVCYRCHTGTGVVNEPISNGWFAGTYASYALAIDEAFGMVSTHPVNDAAPGHLFDLGNGPEELECTSCHDVHQVTGRYWAAPTGVTPVIARPSNELWGDDASEKLAAFDPSTTYQAPYIGEPGLDLNGAPLPIDVAGDSLLTATVTPDYNTLCLSCHGAAVGGLLAIDWASSVHGSVPAEPEGTQGFALALPYDSAQRGAYGIGCLDCHESHGSENRRLLRRSFNGAVAPAVLNASSSSEWMSVCDACHPYVQRHHNQDVYDKVGDSNCLTCHLMSPIYRPCVDSGCHTHVDFF